MSHPSLASKRWVWRQYDHMVRLGATVLPGSECRGLHRPRGQQDPRRHVGLQCDLLPPRPARRRKGRRGRSRPQLACSGAVPLAVTDNLNFGNPHKPENFLMLREAVEGLAEACREFNTPVTAAT